MMVTVGYIIISIDLVTSYLLLSPVRHHNHLRTGSCCGAVVPGNVTRPHPRSAYVDVSPHLHTTRVTWPHVSSTQTRRGDWFYCKLVLVCKMRITGGPGPGFAQQHRHQITSCTLTPESFPDLLWLVRTWWTCGEHVMMVWALSPHLNIYTLWTLLTSIKYLYVWHYLNAW